MAEKSRGQLSDTVRIIREIYESYEALNLINPKQDPGFVIQHLAKIFDKEQNNALVKVESSGGSQIDILGRIRSVYNVYKTLCKHHVDGASEILIQNLKECLSEEEEPKLSDDNMEVLPMEEENDLNIKIVKTQSLPIEAAPQWGEASQALVPILNSRMHLKEEEEVMEQKEQKYSKTDELKSTRYYYKCSTCSKFFQDKKTWKNHRRIHKQELKDSFLCKFCKMSFPHLNLRSIHQDFCSKSPLNKNFKPSSSFEEAKRYRHLPSTSSSTSQNIKVPNEVSTPNSHQNSNSKPVNDGSDAMATKLRLLISNANKKTLTLFGLDRSSFPTLDKKYLCHICPDPDKNWGSLERLANHLRTHMEESEYPFHCLHPKCDRKFKDSSNFRKHLKYPHKENGSYIWSHPRRNISPSKSPMPKNRIIKKKSRMRRKLLTSRPRRPNKNKFICVYCDRQLSTGPALARHIRIHTGERPFACLKCPSKFSRTDRLREHEQSFHRTNKSVLTSFEKDSKSKSSTLSKFTLDSPDRKYNEKMEEEEEEVEEGQVELLPALDLPWAKDEENYKANNDDDKTENPGYFNDEEHFETETNKSDFHFSPYSSSREQSSRNTTNTYSCVQCNRNFMNRGHYISHVRSHVKEEEMRHPTTCLVCKLQFYDMESRLRHEKEHSKNGQYKCEICGSKFVEVIRFIAHRNFVHSC